MKKFILFVYVMLFLCNYSNSEVITNYNDPVVYKTVLIKKGERDANIILYNFAKENLPYLSLEDARAYKVDLNNDRVPEIIGIVMRYDSGTAGSSLFILQKQGDKYEDISTVFVDPGFEPRVLRKKTNGYYNLQVNEFRKYNFAKYENGLYNYFEEN